MSEGGRRVRRHLCHSRKAEIKLRRQTKVFSRAFVRAAEKGEREGNSRDQVSILSGVCPGSAHLERVAGSRNRHSGDAKGGRNQTLRKGGRADRRHVNPTTLVPGMYRVIAPSLPSPPPSPYLSLSLLLFFFCWNRCPAVPPFDVPSTCHCVRSFASAGGTAGARSWRMSRRRLDRFREQSGTFNFHTATPSSRINTALLQ